MWSGHRHPPDQQPAAASNGPAAMTLYLHIGTSKTGTTSIQQFLCHNRSALLHQGYLYPGLGVNIINHRLVWVQNDDHVTERMLELMRREYDDSGARHIIISAECLQARWTSRRPGRIRA